MLADIGNCLERRIEQRSMEVSQVAILYGASQLSYICSKLHPVLLHDVACAADRGCPVVPVFHDLVAGTGDNEASRRTDIERILTVAARADDVNGFVFCQIYRDTHI